MTSGDFMRKETSSFNLFWTYHDSFFIGCCRAHIDWLFSTNYQNLFGVCAAKCKHFRAVSFKKCCLNLTGDLHDLCVPCLDTLSDILVQKLHTFTTPRAFLFESF